MTSIIYTKNSSGAIRRARRRKPKQSYFVALKKYIKYLKSLGLRVDSKGKIKKRYTFERKTFVAAAAVAQQVEQLICNQKVGGSIPSGGTKPVSNWRLEESKKFTIAPAYNKGGYQVISKDNVKHIGK
tara:strand:+ start:1564 stop:1947 length:384 start_codon:yes stop_codon:yes gene_type:complete